MNPTLIDKTKSSSKLWIAKVQKVLNTNFDRAFGMDISDKSIELVELSKLFRFSIENFSRVELEDGIIKEGRILNEAGLAENIKKLLLASKPRKVSTNKVILSMPESQVFTHHMILHSILKGEALRALVQAEVTKTLPILPGLMYWDIISKPIGIDTISVTFVGILKEIAESYIRVCNSVGLSVVRIGLPTLSVARLVLSPESKVTAIVDMGTHTTNVSIVKGNDEICLNISIPIGGSNMTKAISAGQNIDEVEAEKKKLSIGSSESDEILFLIEPVIKNISMEIRRVITYYETMFKESVESVMVVGGAGVMGGIDRKMTEVIGKPVSLVKHFNNFENISMLSNDKAAPVLFTSVIGLGMLGASNEFSDMNLLKQIPSGLINKVNRTALFNSGYLGKATAVRVFLNSRIMLVASIALCVGSLAAFSYLWFNYQLGNKYQPKVYTTSNLKINALSKAFDPARYLGGNASSTATSTLRNATSTLINGAFPFGTSTTALPRTSTTTRRAATSTR